MSNSSNSSADFDVSKVITPNCSKLNATDPGVPKWPPFLLTAVLTLV